MKCQRHILLPNVHNFRDLGGYPAKNDRVTRWGIIFRTDSLAELTEEGWEGLKGLGVGCIIDLRSAREREQLPVKPLYDLDYLPFSLMGDSKYGPAPTQVPDDEEDEASQGKTQEGSAGDKDFVRSTRLDYTSTLFNNIGTAADILDVILSVLDGSKGSVAFMCTAGKDRTGMVAAMLLYLSGVPDEDIIADYMVSNVYNTNGINKKMETMIREIMKRDVDPSFMEAGMSSSPDTMRRLLDSFRRKDIKKALSDNGFGAEKQEKLADLMTE